MSAFVSLLTALLAAPPSAGDGARDVGAADTLGDADHDADTYGDGDAWHPDGAQRPIDYAPANAAVGALLGWGCGIARARAPEPDDAAAIDRVEAYARAVFGPPGALAMVTPPPTTDFLITGAAMIEAFAVDFATPELTQLVGAASSIADWWLRSAAPSQPTGWAAAVGALVAALRPRPRFAYGVDDLDLATRNDNRQPAPRRYAVAR